MVALSDAWGSAVQVNRYDEYGIPASGNAGTFQYTGQVWVPEIGMYYYKARMYSPTLGRFMQTDPIGYGDGPNWYNYVGSDPVNKTDPSGLCGIVGRLCSLSTNPRADGGGATSAGGYLKYTPWTSEHTDPKTTIYVDSQWRWISTGLAHGELSALNGFQGASGDGGGGGQEKSDFKKQSCPGNLSSTIGSARLVLATTADVSGLASVGFAAAGITAPAAVAAKIVNVSAQLSLGALNLYDGAKNGNWAPLLAQGATLAADPLGIKGALRLSGMGSRTNGIGSALAGQLIGSEVGNKICQSIGSGQ